MSVSRNLPALRAVALGLALLGHACADDARTCTLLQAHEGIDVTLSAEDWDVGNYALLLAGEGFTLTCAFRVAEPGILPPASECTRDPQSAAADFSALRTGDASLAVFVVGTPDTLHVRLTRDCGAADTCAVLADAEHALVYTSDEPNGRGCGKRAVAALAIALEVGTDG
jgi:hypothetical protein